MTGLPPGDDDALDLEAWKRAWRRMPHRRLPAGGPKLGPRDGWPPIPADSPGWGAVVACTISEDPPEYADRNGRLTDRCPVCGERTRHGPDRLPATLHPAWAGGPNLGLGVWAHRACFDACDDAGPLPWFPA